jgi:predicted nucleic acid-binding protein
VAGDQGQYLASPRDGSKVRALVDTNVLVRHLTGDPPSQARRATALLRSSHELILTDLVLAEMVYVLESFYEVPRAEIAGMARALLALPSIEAGDHDLLLRAVEIYEVLRLDFAEAYLSALAEMSDVNRVASFDRQIDRVKSIQRIEP